MPLATFPHVLKTSNMAAIGPRLRSTARLWSQTLRSSRAVTGAPAAGRPFLSSPGARSVSSKPPPSPPAIAHTRPAEKSSSKSITGQPPTAATPTEWLVIEGLPEGTTSDGPCAPGQPLAFRGTHLLTDPTLRVHLLALHMICEIHGAIDARVGTGPEEPLPSSSGWVAFPSTWHATGALFSLAHTGIGGIPVKVMFVQKDFLDTLEVDSRARAVALEAASAVAVRAPVVNNSLEKLPGPYPAPWSDDALSRPSLLPVERGFEEEAPDGYLLLRESPPTAGLRILNLPPWQDADLRRLVEIHVPDRPFFLRRRWTSKKRQPSIDGPKTVDVTFGSVEDAIAAKKVLDAIVVDGYPVAIHFHDAAKSVPLEELLSRDAIAKEKRASPPQPRPQRPMADHVRFREDEGGKRVVVATRGLRLTAAPGTESTRLVDELVVLLHSIMMGRRYHLEVKEKEPSPVVDLTFDELERAIHAKKKCKHLKVGGQPVEVSVRRSMYVGLLDEAGGLVRTAAELKIIRQKAKIQALIAAKIECTD
jgi:hypothetical protein